MLAADGANEMNSPVEERVVSTHFDAATTCSSNSSNRIAMFSHKENGDPNIEVLDIPIDSRTCSLTTSATESHSRLLTSVMESKDYDNLSGFKSYGWDEPSTTVALDLCKKYVLNPYNTFLKVIGWRSFRSQYDNIPWYKKICNIAYPLFIFVMLIFGCTSQIITCFSRARSQPPVPVGNYSVLNCYNHFVSRDILVYLLILGPYLGGFVIFRFAETEHLSSLSETVFLSYNYTNSRNRKRPVFILLTFLVCGLIWFIFSFGTSILRIFVLQLNKPTTIIHWFTNNSTAINQEDHLKINYNTYNVLRLIFVSLSMLGFAFFDLLYIAVVINYVSQCQLLIFYIENIKDKVINKRYKTLTDASKEIFHVYEFLSVLNRKLAIIATLIMFVFINNIISAYLDLSKNGSTDPKNITLGFLNLLQWISICIFPIAMASLLTARCKSLSKVGLQIASRPFVYSDTPALDLQMFLNYTNSTGYAAKLALIPMYPGIVLGGTFILMTLFTLNIIIPSITAVNWF